MTFQTKMGPDSSNFDSIFITSLIGGSSHVLQLGEKLWKRSWKLELGKHRMGHWQDLKVVERKLKGQSGLGLVERERLPMFEFSLIFEQQALRWPDVALKHA